MMTRIKRLYKNRLKDNHQAVFYFTMQVFSDSSKLATFQLNPICHGGENSVADKPCKEIWLWVAKLALLTENKLYLFKPLLK